MKNHKVIVLSPSNFSLYTLSTIVSLQRSGIQIAGVGVRRLVDPKRLLFELERNALRIIKKIGRKLLFRNQIYHNATKETLSYFLKEHEIELRTIKKLCKKENIPLYYCFNFNENEFVNRVKELSADAIIFTGGGLIRKPLLEATPKGILNCHMGILPIYRGMDLPEWAVLNGDFDQIGCSVHIMDSGVDTGPILSKFIVEPQLGDNIRSIRDRIEYHMTSVLSETAFQYLNDQIIPQKQSILEGKQFFTMMPMLLDVTEQKLSTAFNSKINQKTFQ